MNKVVSYSIFRHNCEEFEYQAYLRGCYFNARMNKIVYPDWTTWLNADKSVFVENRGYFEWLMEEFGVFIELYDHKDLCRMMLWRLNPAFDEERCDIVICRDSDALTSHREAQSVNSWIHSGNIAHSINDNEAHGGMMGGLVGFKADFIRRHFKDFQQLVEGFDLSKRGSDQYLLNSHIAPLIGKGLKTDIFPKRDTSNKLWESNLCSFFIGAAGFNELETLRFFKRFDNKDRGEKGFKNILYWA